MKDDSEHKIIPQAIGLLSGRTAQEYNQRKHRKGAFWEDRYHSTAIETGEHLLRYLVYIDLNMARGRTIRPIKDGFELRESQSAYNAIFAP